MDSRDLLILGGVGLGAYVLWAYRGRVRDLLSPGGTPAVFGNPTGAASMNQAAAATTTVGGSTVTGLVAGLWPFAHPPSLGSAPARTDARRYKESVASLLGVNLGQQQPVPTVAPFTFTPTLGVPPVQGMAPKPVAPAPLFRLPLL